MEDMNLTDNAISHIAKLVQVAILTGTDVVDNLRTARFVNKDGEIELSPDYHEQFNTNINSMMEEATAAVSPTEEQTEWVTVDVPKEAITRVKIEKADNEE